VTDGDYQFVRDEVPLPPALRAELVAFWSQIFQIPFNELDEVLAGEEGAVNTDVFYLARRQNELAATCHLTRSHLDPRLGGMGEVATHCDHRGKGLANVLFDQAAREFDSRGGEALLLGTVNPVAATIYEKFGFHYLPNTKVMLRTRAAAGEFFDHWFRDASSDAVEIISAGPQHRLTIIPLILCPNPGEILDINADLLSTHVAEQVSCMGLYPRYHALGHTGQWFVAQTPDQVTVGIASVKLMDGGVARIDAFTHPAAQGRVLRDLYHQAASWAQEQNRTLQAICSDSDERKQAALSALNFKASGNAMITVAKQTFPITVFSKR
jgi:GNAT superfamily N-acetyltransferase